MLQMKKTESWGKRIQTYPERVQTYECCKRKKWNSGANACERTQNVCKRICIKKENSDYKQKTYGNVSPNACKRKTAKKEKQ